MRLKDLTAVMFLVVSAACAGGSAGVSDGPVDLSGGGQSEKLHLLFDRYFEEYLELNPVFATFIGDNRYNDRFANNIGPEHRNASLALEKTYLEALGKIGSKELRGQDLLSYEVFKRRREVAIEGFRFPSHLIPVNQFFSVPNSFTQMGSGGGIHPFRTEKDYRDFLGRIDGFEIWVDQAIANMREGIEKGIVQPRVLMEKTIPQLDSQVTETPQASLFYQPIKEFPEGMSPAVRKELTEKYTAAIQDRIIPAYKKLRDFIQNDYLPRTRDSVGLKALPGGSAWYAYLARRSTTTDLSPAEIHRIGLAEVKRIRGEMERVKEEGEFDGDLRAFFDFLNENPDFYFDDKEELLAGYRGLRERIHRNAANLFDRFPEADYEIRAVEPFRERSASGASYRAATPDGSRPGVFYVNTYDIKARPKWAMESLFLHEAIPGHHFQISLQREIEDLPRFRRFGGFTAFSEGWGLYSEGLGKELGVYRDPYQYFGALQAELWRALRLVVDTGLHDQDWSRERVLAYMYENSAVKEARAVSEAERYIAIPGQALAYKVGQLKISELRARAEKKLGKKFDLKKFHTVILADGALPLDVLEAKVDRWIDQLL